MHLKPTYVALLAASLVAPAAHATNGYFLPGFGIRSQGMGGVGIAYGRDSLSTAANPANAAHTGMRGDLGFAVFNPERHASLRNDASTPSAGFFTDSGYFDGEVESDAKYFIMPEMGFSMPLDDKLHISLAVVGNGGMNTTYPENFFSFFGAPPVDKKVGVDMMQLLVPISVAYKVRQNHTIGASLVLAETRFRAYGLDAFKTFPINTASDDLTNKGFDYSYGAGVRLGWIGTFMDDRIRVGLTYASKTYMSKFDEYKGLFAEQGDFDIPENYGIGVAFKPVKNLVIAADVMRINFNKVKSVGNPGPGEYSAAGLGIPGMTGTQNDLGADAGMGFGWENQTVYKIGIQYGVNNRLQVRAGYNYGRSPIPNNQVTFNLLAPATVEKHYTLGFTYRANDNLEVTGTYLYAAPHSQSACNQNIVDCASFNMHQNMFGLTFGWVLDPGPGALDEYGESEMAPINFDGWYAGLGIGQSRYRSYPATSENGRTEGWKVYGGYQFNKYLALEGGYVNLNDVQGVSGNVRTDIATEAWTFGPVLTYPVSNKLSLIARAGAAYMQGEVRTNTGTAVTRRTSDDGYEPFYGVGARYAVFDNLGVRAEWERYDRDDYNIDLLTAGIDLKF